MTFCLGNFAAERNDENFIFHFYPMDAQNPNGGWFIGGREI
jgi:hypothetical protein